MSTPKTYVPPHLRGKLPASGGSSTQSAPTSTAAEKAALEAAAFEQRLKQLAEDKAASDAACAALRRLKPPPITSTAAALKAVAAAEFKASEQERIERGELTEKEEADIAHQEFSDDKQVAAENYAHDLRMAGQRVKLNSPEIMVQVPEEL
jgi:hypothetical protein